MKFGKYIASIASQWAEPYYLNYKGLKKIISSDKNNVTFFFTLERELEKVNSFYLQKEKELKIRCENLLKILNFPNSASQHILKEYVIQFQADLANLQNFVSVNAMGFSKILKKFDKHRKAVTKEIYLSSKVDVQPCFNNEVLVSLSDSAAQMLADLESIFLSTNPEFDSDCSKFLLEKNHTALKTALVQNPQNRSVLSNLFLLHCSGTSLECLKVLLETGNVDFCSYRDSLSLRNSLFDVVNTGNVEKLKLLLEYKADPNQSDLYGKTTLHYAAMNGFTKCVKVLIGNCEINALDFDGKTPLLEAIYGGHTDTVRLLLENSADPEPQENCINALSLACDNGHFEIVALLLKRNVPMKRNSQGLFPLHLSAKNGHLEITKMLIEFGVDVNAKDLFYGWTPAFFSVQEGHVSILSLLIDAGADINSADSEGWYPLTYALYHGHLDIANILTAKSERHPHKDMSTAYNLKEKNNAAAIDSMELEDIPALTLPPPVMPLRIYGHSYLDGKSLLKIEFLGKESINLFKSKYLHSLRLLVSSHTIDDIPHSIILPFTSKTSITFDVADFDRFSIVFEIYPAFGSLILAKQIVLYEQIRNTIENNCFAKHSGHLTVPLLDKNLESVGKLSFACSLVTPFQHPAMKIGGSVDTYWKSPRIYPTLANGDQKKMITSLSTEYIVAQVVMTGDGHIVTLQTTTDQWPMLFKMTLDEIKLSNSSVISLEDMLMGVTKSVGVCLKLLFPCKSHVTLFGLSQPDLNRYVDMILTIVYNQVDNRPVIFLGSNMDLCTAVNWKQPNFSVFYQVQKSVKKAIKFAKTENLLGVVCNLNIFTQMPILVNTVKQSGLLLITTTDNLQATLGMQENLGVDGLICGGRLRLG